MKAIQIMLFGLLALFLALPFVAVLVLHEIGLMVRDLFTDEA